MSVITLATCETAWKCIIALAIGLLHYRLFGSEAPVLTSSEGLGRSVDADEDEVGLFDGLGNGS